MSLGRLTIIEVYNISKRCAIISAMAIHILILWFNMLLTKVP